MAPFDDEAKEFNKNLPSRGGVFNYLNLSLYHYSNNNPIRYYDPNGLETNEKEEYYFSAYKPAWYNSIPVIKDISKELGDIIMTFTRSDTNPITREVYLPGDRFDAAWSAVMGNVAMALGGFAIGKSTKVAQFLAKFKTELHHLLPRQFDKFFKAAGLNIERFKTPLTMLKHRGKIFGQKIGIHPEWNKAWGEFFAKNPKASPEEIFEQLGKMIKDFKIKPKIKN